MNNAAGATYVLAFSGWHETGEKGITVDRHTGLAERRLGDRVVLWEVVVLHNIANIGHNIFRIEVKATEACYDGVSDSRSASDNSSWLIGTRSGGAGGTGGI